jgi:hypothetical protein
MERQNFWARHFALTTLISMLLSIVGTLAWSAPKKPSPKPSLQRTMKPSKSVSKKKSPKTQASTKKNPTPPKPTATDVMMIEGGTQESDGSISVGGNSPESSVTTVTTESPTEEIAMDLEVDLGSTSDGGTSGFNPYNFDRDPIWILLPALTLILLGLHLLPVPKRKLKKLTPQTKLFAGIDGKENTKSLSSTTRGGT